MKLSLTNCLIMVLIFLLLICHPVLWCWLVGGGLIVALLVSIGVLKITVTIEENKEQRKSTHF